MNTNQAAQVNYLYTDRFWDSQDADDDAKVVLAHYYDAVVRERDALVAGVRKIRQRTLSKQTERLCEEILAKYEKDGGRGD